MSKKRRKFSKEFKLKVILAALKERETLSELGQRFELHPQQITNWKKGYLEKSLSILDTKSNKEELESVEKEKRRLYEKIGQLQMENDFLKKNLNL